ncbi:MAG: IS110 family transposase [Alteromonadales bacterium]|nr:IS110 family transposase [Alteromonadales bacterium]
MKLVKSCNHWTDKHLKWLNKKISELSADLRFNFESLLMNLVQSEIQVKKYDDKIEEIAKLDCYSNQCTALTALKGVKTLTALSLIVEIGDIKRFANPKKLVSYAGMDIIEYSSGGKENKFGITKKGNKHIRTAVVESAQTIGQGTCVGKVLRLRREKIDPEIVEIALRCQTRLTKKKQNLTRRGKNPNVIKVACAREMLGFIWEILSKVA